MTSSGSARPARRNTASPNGSAGEPVVTPAAHAAPRRSAGQTRAAKPAKATPRQPRHHRRPRPLRPPKPSSLKRLARRPNPAKSAKTKDSAAASAWQTAKRASQATWRRKHPAAPAPKGSGRTREDKDQPLFQDIRYLGRLLGDVVREQEGDAVFDVVETIRQTPCAFAAKTTAAPRRRSTRSCAR